MPIILLAGVTEDLGEIGTIDAGASIIVGPYEIDLEVNVAPLSIDVATIDGAAPVAGIGILLEDTAPDPFQPDAYVALYNAAGVKISDLVTQNGVSWSDPLNETGAGRFNILLDDPDAALVIPGTEARIFMFGEVVFTFVILQNPRIARLQDGEETSHVIQVQGPGRPALLERALVYAPKGTANPINAQHRIYSFASVDYPVFDGFSSADLPPGWTNPVEQFAAQTIGPWRYQYIEYTTVISGQEDIVEVLAAPSPIEWPIPDARWIWGQPDSFPPGYNYFRRDPFVLSGKTSVRILATGDNYYTLYLDGSPILGEQETINCWQEWKQVDLVLPAGAYYLSAIVHNVDIGLEGQSGAGPAALLCAVVELDGENEPIVPAIVQSQTNGWSSLPYPSVVPGWTPGEIMIDAINEVQVRGGLTDFEYDFTATNDSLGEPWPIIPAFSINIGGSVKQILDKLVEQGWVDWRVRPGGKLLQMFIAETIKEPSGVDYEITSDVDTQNLRNLQFVPQGDIFNQYLVKWTNGYFTIQDTDSIAEWGVFEGMMTVDTEDVDEATREAALLVERNSQPRWSILATIEPLGEADSPYSAYGPGEEVRVPNQSDVLTNYQVQGITGAVNDFGRVDFSLELENRLGEREREREALVADVGRLLTGDTEVRNTKSMFTRSVQQ